MAENVRDEPSLSPKNKRKRAYCENYSSDVVEDASYEDFLCPICLQLLIEPVVMPCKHELCKICFTQNVQEANLQCPICRVRISSWARKQARNGTLICKQRWERIQKLFPERCERRMRGIDDDGDEFCHRPLKRILSENGEIRSEYEEEMRKIRMAREEECRASEEFIHQLMEQENQVHEEMEQLREKDEEVARRIHQQINEVQTATPIKVVNKQTGSSSKAKGTAKTSSSPTLERWFSPTSSLKKASSIHKSDQSNTSQVNPKVKSNTDGDPNHQAKNLDEKYKQEQDDYAFAMKLQQQFDKERKQEQKLERKKGTVDGYMLRKDSCTSTNSSFL